MRDCFGEHWAAQHAVYQATFDEQLGGVVHGAFGSHPSMSSGNGTPVCLRELKRLVKSCARFRSSQHFGVYIS